MTVLAASKDLKFYARRRWPLANDKFRKDRLAELLDLTKRRIKSLYEGDRNAVLRQHEAESIERLTGKKLGAAAELEEARHEYRTLAQLEASLEALADGPHESFYRPLLDAFRAAALPQGEGAPRGRGRIGAGDQGRGGPD